MSSFAKNVIPDESRSPFCYGDSFMRWRIKTQTQIAMWAMAIGLVIVIGQVYFPREYKDEGFWGTLYFTIRLFVFE